MTVKARNNPFCPQSRQRDGNRCRCDENQNACCVGTSLRIDVGFEQHRDEERNRREQHDERPRRFRPFRRHAVARQIARYQIEQAGHRRRARKPQNRDGADVVDRPEHIRRGNGGQGRTAHVPTPLPPRETPPAGSACVVTIELPMSMTLMMSAAVRRSFLVFRMRPIG